MLPGWGGLVGLGCCAAPSAQLHHPLPKPCPSHSAVAVPSLILGAGMHVRLPGEQEKPPSTQHSVVKSTVLGALQLHGLGGAGHPVQDQLFSWDKLGDPREEALALQWSCCSPGPLGQRNAPFPCPSAVKCVPQGLLPGLDSCLRGFPKSCLHSQHPAGEPAVP